MNRWCQNSVLVLCGIIALLEHLKDFLEENGFGHALTKFVEQEVEILKICELSNGDAVAWYWNNWWKVKTQSSC